MPDLIAVQFIKCNRGEDFGTITPECAAACKVASGAIRLQHGYEGHKGYGNRHVEAYAGRMDQLRGLGYKTFSSFAEDVAQNYDRVEANAPGSKGEPRVKLIWRTRGYDFRLVVQYVAESGCWTITTGQPLREQDGEVLYRVDRTGECEPAPTSVVKKSRFATLSLRKPKTGDGNGS